MAGVDPKAGTTLAVLPERRGYQPNQISEQTLGADRESRSANISQWLVMCQDGANARPARRRSAKGTCPRDQVMHTPMATGTETRQPAERPGACRRRQGRLAHLRDGGRPGRGALQGRSADRRRRVRLLHRPVRLRQDHAAAGHRRSRAADRRHDRGQRRDPRRSPARAALRLRLPGAGALSVADHRAQRDAAARDHGLLRPRSERRGPRAISRSSISPASSASFPGNCPAACSSAPRSPARSRSIRRCC